MPKNNENFNNTGQPVGGSDDGGLTFRILKTGPDGSLVTTGGGSGSNAAAGPTGIAVPAQADYVGINISGNLTGLTGFSLTGSKAAAVAIVDGSGNQITSFGGGTQFADNAASGGTPTGTLSMGWDSANSKIRALKVDASQNLLVAIGAAVDVSDRVGRLLGHVTVDNASIAVTIAAAVTVAQSTAANLNATIVFASAQHVIVDSGAITVSGTVTANIGTTNGLALDASVLNPQVAGGGTTAPTKVQMVGGKTNDGSPQYDIMPLGAGGRSVIVEGFAGGTAVPVSIAGTVAVSIAAAVDVSDRTARLLGHVTVDNASIAVTGTFFQATQPVSIAATVVVAGAKTNNNAAPGATNVGALVAVANAAVQGWTEGNEVLLSTDLSGLLRVSLKDTASNTNNLNVNIAASGATVTITGAVTATLNAETTKVIGVVRTADGSGNLLTSTGNALDVNLKTSSITLPVSIAATVTVSGTVTANQGSPNTLANKWPVQVTDGTNVMPTGDAAARTIHVTVDAATLGTVAENITQINGQAVVSSGLGVMKVGICGAGGAALDISGDNVSPTNQLLVAGVYNSATGTTTPLTAGNEARLQLDANGLLLTRITSASNVAQETGGNLATLASNTRNDAQMLDVLDAILAQIRLLNINFASQTNQAFQDSDAMVLDQFSLST